VCVLCHQLDSGVYSLAMLAAHHTQQYPQIPVIAARARCCGVRLNEGSYTVLIKVRSCIRVQRSLYVWDGASFILYQRSTKCFAVSNGRRV
jgi:hypothetical protein